MSNIYANKSTASRVLGQMGIPKELRAELIKGEAAPFEINEKEVRKVLKSLKAAKDDVSPAVRAVTEMFESDRNKAQNAVEDALISKATKVVEQTDAEWEAEQRAALAKAAPSSAPAAPAKAATVRKANPRQNGKSRPSKGVCCAIWDELDKFYADFKGQIPTPAEAQQMGVANNWHKVTVYRQYNDWMVFHGHK